MGDIASDQAVAPKLVNHLKGGGNLPVVKLRSPRELREAFADIGVPLPIGEDDGPVDQAALLRSVDAVLEYSVNTTNPHFSNQLYGTADPIGVAGDWVVSVLNANAHTFEVAPVFTAIEFELLEKFGRIVGGDFAVGCEGLFVPGGALSNLYAMHLARHR